MAQLCKQMMRLSLLPAVQRRSTVILATSLFHSSASLNDVRVRYVYRPEATRGLFKPNHTIPGESFYYQHEEESLEDVPKTGLVGKNSFRTDRKKLQDGEWPWNTGIRSRFPEHYKQYWVELYSREPIPVHYRKDNRKYDVDEFGIRRKVYNRPIPVFYNKMSDEGLWGGEGLVIGVRTRKNDEKKPRTPRIWKPRLYRQVFYSEILDKHMFINVTRRTLNLVDEAYGFDSYILKTHPVDLRSRLGMMLKKQMLLALANETLCPTDAEKRERIISKYQEYIVPVEQAEWLGLTMQEAEEKQRKLEEQEEIDNVQPLKYLYAQQLIKDIQDDNLKLEDGPSWWTKLSPFKDKNEKNTS